MVSDEGRLYTWGSASFGRLGIPDGKKSRFSPLEVPFFRSIPIHSLASGDFHMLALAHDCSVYAWGYGNDGQSGTGTLQHLKTPRRIDFFDNMQVVGISCGSAWSSAISAAGVLYVWGYGDGGW
jgi:alpha-tubulin suppressor-like RCC1 family protein